MYTILGAGLSGISASFHLGHENCEVFEKNHYIGGHIHSEIINGFTWDEGPHVSFTKNEYVKTLFANNVSQDFLEYPVETANYYKGNWIPHPAQSNLFTVPQPLRDLCLKDFLESRQIANSSSPKNYEEWLIAAFGKTFYQYFPKIYTEKYWTLSPKLLTTDWVGERVFYPKIKDVEMGYLKPLDRQTHYISHIRYPKNGGYFSYINKIKDHIQINLNKELKHISFKAKKIYFTDDSVTSYQKLINTIPLPELLAKSDAPDYVKENANLLSCSSVLIINIEANHSTQVDYNWIYVYDDDKYATRINCTELLSPNNAPTGKSGIQVEVYFSRYKEKMESNEEIAQKVCLEMVEMGLVKDLHFIAQYHYKWVKWANVIFDFERKNALNEILSWLETQGLKRDEQDLLPNTKWENYAKNPGDFQLAGRFAEWKYYWTDDCVLRGLYL